ncbi:MAG TPA: FtsQ-type POTRA domain-containing protein [Chthoniobacterales bacterium]|nr:FtsQ-type POTRA domain-containing protein [Chthoniobacterales bacterium]
MRSRKAVQHRNRKVLVGFSKVTLVIALLFAIYIGGRIAAKRFFIDNPDYKLTSIEVQTDGTLQRDQILSVADIHEGENIFRVNLGHVHDRLQELPQVDEVEVVRKLPSEIDVRIVERKPIGWITSEKQIADPFASDAAFLVDARGVLMKEKKLLPEYLGLPAIVGCATESLEAGKTVVSPDAKAALELLRLSTRSFMQTRFQIREIDLSKGYCLVVTDKNHSKVTFGFDNLDLQLQRLEQFLVYSDDAHREIATVNLLVQRNIPVTFQKSANEVINDTINPAESPRVMKAIALNAPPKASPAPAVAKSHPKSKPPAAATPKPRQIASPSPSPTPTPARRGFLQPFRKN